MSSGIPTELQEEAVREILQLRLVPPWCWSEVGTAAARVPYFVLRLGGLQQSGRLQETVLSALHLQFFLESVDVVLFLFICLIISVLPMIDRWFFRQCFA